MLKFNFFATKPGIGTTAKPGIGTASSFVKDCIKPKHKTVCGVCGGVA